jgi:hypothetical protein
LARFPRSQYTRDLQMPTGLAKPVHPNRQAHLAPSPYFFFTLETIVPPHFAPLSKSLRTPGNQLHSAQPLPSLPRAQRTYEQMPGAV